MRKPPERQVPAQGARRDSSHYAGDQLDQKSGLAEQRNPVHDLLDSFIGLQVDGGCDDCTAYQTIERLSHGVYINRIHHDDTCPWWIRYQAATP
jgi:hypothetical protein